MAGGWSSRQHPSSDSTYLQVFPGSLVGGEKRPPKTPTSLSDTRKPVSLHVSPIQGHTGETRNQRGRAPLLPRRSLLFRSSESEAERPARLKDRTGSPSGPPSL